MLHGNVSLTQEQAIAVGLKGVSCGNVVEEIQNYLLNGGCKGHGENKTCGGPKLTGTDLLNGRCRQIEADSAFLFLGFLASVSAAVLCWMASRRGGSMKQSAV